MLILTYTYYTYIVLKAKNNNTQIRILSRRFAYFNLYFNFTWFLVLYKLTAGREILRHRIANCRLLEFENFRQLSSLQSIPLKITLTSYLFISLGLLRNIT